LPGLISALSVVGGAFAALLGPVGAIAAGVAAAATLIISNWEQVKAAFVQSGLAKLVKRIGSKIKDGVQIIIGAVVFLFKQLNATSKEGKSTFQSVLSGLFRVVKGIMSAMFSVMKTIFEAIAPLITSATVAFEKFSTFMTNIFSDPKKAIKALGDIFKQVFTGILNVIEAVINGLFEFVQKLAGIIPGVDSAMESAKSAVTDAKESIVDALDLKEQQKNINNTKDAITGLASKFKELGSLPSIPSLGGGGSGGSGGGGDDTSLSKVNRGVGGFSGPEKAPIIPEGSLDKIKDFERIQKNAAFASELLSKNLGGLSERQKRLAAINQQAGQIIGRTMKRTTQQLSKTFAAALTGTQSLAKGMAAFGDFMQKMFRRLIQKVIQLITKLLVVKAIQATLGAATGGLGSGLIGGLTQGAGGLVGNILGGGIGGGGSSGMGGRTVNLQQRGDTMRSTLDFNQKKKNRAGVN